MSRPYFSKGTTMCFDYSAEAHRYQDISSEEYLDRMLAHLQGVRHPEDISPATKILDPLSMTIRNCVVALRNSTIANTDDIKSLFLESWTGKLNNVKLQLHTTLHHLHVFGIVSHIFEALLCLACQTSNSKLLEYLTSLTEHMSMLSGSNLRPLQSAIRDMVPSVELWKILLDCKLYFYGLPDAIFDPDTELSWPLPISNDSGYLKALSHERRLDLWATQALANDLPAIELLQFLLDRGFTVTEEYVNAAARTMSSSFIRFLVSKATIQYKNSYGLMNAISNCHSAQIIDVLIDAGMDVNFQTPTPKWKDPFDFRAANDTALHSAAEAGKLDVVRLLLERGAKRDQQDEYRRTAEVIAAQGGFNDIVELLRKFEPMLGRYMVDVEIHELCKCGDLESGQHRKNLIFVAKKALETGLLIDFGED
ncbi:ankyrin repeat-containing domain protein [Leptodontidium sp. MPI-SDFR-AT-0119]|nr:ankyrin repeat-containing domain protein [Leptodontidium sp. MPI-SDFR-AT-0119]